MIEFADIDKHTVKFLRFIMLGLLQHNKDTIRSILNVVIANPKLKTLSESLRLFLHHFVLKGYVNKKGTALSPEARGQIQEMCKFVDDILTGVDTDSKL